MNLDKEHFRAYIFIEFRRGKSPSEIHEQLLEAELNESPSRATVIDGIRGLPRRDFR